MTLTLMRLLCMILRYGTSFPLDELLAQVDESNLSKFINVMSFYLIP